jgi:lysophospholipase L1-like esterase
MRLEIIGPARSAVDPPRARTVTAAGDAAARQARARARAFIEAHQRLILVVWTVLLLCLLAAVAEAVLRHTTPYRVDYYTGTVVSKRLIRYPFGDMPFNAHGYPDRDWLDDDPRPRVGFWGDSITSGVGAGFGYRFTDIIGASLPDRDYRNFGGVGEDGIADAAAADRVVAAAKRYGLRKIVYAMDLNDLLPDRDTHPQPHSMLYRVKRSLAPYLDPLRTRSYLYNYLRTKVTTAAARLGYGYHGDEAYELHPARNAAVITQTVNRINLLADRLGADGVQLCVAIFPFEMQVSTEAAARYRQYGIRWSAELLQGEPQKMLLAALSKTITGVDLAGAFRQDSLNRDVIGVGQYFVFNRGDALDWIHPNRGGHRLIARYLLTQAPSCL